MDPFSDRNWRFHLHAWRMLDPIWEEFHGRNWDRLHDEVMPWVRDWYRYHVTEARESSFSWYDMAVGFRAQHLAMLVHLHDQGSMPLSQYDLSIVEELCRLHHGKLRNRHFIAQNNHGIFQLQGLRLLGAACEEREGFAGVTEYSSKMMLQLLNSQFDEFGVHVENSPDYHGLILKQIARLRPELFPTIADRIRNIVSKAREVLPWFTFPDGRIVPFGDSEGFGMMLGQSALPDAQFCGSEGTPFFLRDLSASGYVVIRTPPDVNVDSASMLAVRGHSKSATHAHADSLSFVLFDRGVPLFVDSGKYRYNRDQWREYFAGDKAHNVVGLKGVRMGPQHTAEGPQGIDRIEVDDEAGTVMISGHTSRREFFRHRRAITYHPLRRIEVRDEVTARADDEAVVYWHLAAGLDAERAHDGVNVYRNGTQLARLTVAQDGVKARLVHGQEKPYIQGWLSPSYAVREPATVIEFLAPPGMREIHTNIELSERTERDESRLPRRLTHGIRFRFNHKFRRDRVFLLPTGHTQRRVVVELPDADIAVADRRLRAALEEKGFSVPPRKWVGTTIRSNHVHEDGTRVVTKLTPATTSEGGGKPGPATLYFAWSRLGALTSRDAGIGKGRATGHPPGTPR